MTRPLAQDGSARAGAAPILQRIWELARLDAQRPGNIGAGIKVMEMLMSRADFKPSNGGQA